MKKTLLITLTLLLVAVGASAKTLQQSCNNTLKNLGACSQAQVGDPGALIFYWLPQARAIEIRDAFVANRNYQSLLLCVNEPAEPVRPWDASIAYVEQGHCSQAQADAASMVVNPINQNNWVDFQIRLWVRQQARNYRIRNVVEPVADAEAAKPIEQFEENPD